MSKFTTAFAEINIAKLIKILFTQADGKEGDFEEYVDYGAILTGEKEADDDEDDADFAPPR
jgi:hypothetical protein